jgi:hypothetical protein
MAVTFKRKVGKWRQREKERERERNIMAVLLQLFAHYVCQFSAIFLPPDLAN